MSVWGITIVLRTVMTTMEVTRAAARADIHLMGMAGPVTVRKIKKTKCVSSGIPV